MVFNPQIHQRRSIRHRGHDYGAHGAYFITVCTHRRAPLFGHIASGQMHPNDAGRMVQSVWDDLNDFYPNIHTDEFIIMPDHIHGIVHVGAAPCGRPDVAGICDGQPRGVAPTGILSLPDAVHRLKSLITRYYMDAAKRSQWPCLNGRLWQRNYWERIIRSDDELRATRRYIQNNPMRWQNR